MGVNKVVFGAVSIMDISDSTVTPEKLAKGETAYAADGEKITGTMEAASDPVLQEKTVSPTTSKQSVTPDSGYDGLSKVTVNAMTTATQATPSISVSSSGLITASTTQSAGYVASGTKSATKQLTVQAAQTITPGTSNKTIASGRYLTGTQTIAGDSNLVAENIAEGVSIFGVTGTPAGGGGGGSEELVGLIEGTLSSLTNADATSVGDYAFASCNSLTNVSLPAATNIGSSAFASCNSLTNVSLPAATNIGERAFANCQSLRKVNLPAATDIGERAFYYCTSLPSINLPAATNIRSGAFYSCRVLTSINLPTATDIGSSAFYNCSYLSSINLPAATDIGNSAFYYCTSLPSINLPAATDIGSYAFCSCHSLTNVNLPAASYIRDYAFRGCYRLTKVVLGASSVCSLYRSTAFSGTSMSTTGWFYVPSSLIASYQAATNWAYFSSRFSAIEDM